jgi:cyclically-permuted mutarotase family protein
MENETDISSSHLLASKKNKHIKRIGIIIIIAMTELSCINQRIIHGQQEVNEIEWSVPAELPSPGETAKQPGVAGPVAGIVNDRLVVAGGANFPGGMPWQGAKKVYHDEIYIFEKKNGVIVNGTISSEKLPVPIAYCASVTTPGGLMFIGGENEQGISDKVFLIKMEAARFIFSAMPGLPLPLTNLSAVYHDNVIYVAGGTSKEGNSNTFFSFDITKPGAGWKSLPDIPVKISFAVMTVQFNGESNCIYLMGGRRKNSNGTSDIFNKAYQFDISNNQWQEKQPLPHSVSAGTGIAVDKNSILLFGGDKGETFSKEERISVAISQETNEEKKKELTKQKIELLQSHPGFTNDVLLYNAVTDTWKKINPLSVYSPVTTTVVKWGDDIVIPSGEIRAGVRTPGVLVGKIK